MLAVRRLRTERRDKCFDVFFGGVVFAESSCGEGDRENEDRRTGLTFPPFGGVHIRAALQSCAAITVTDNFFLVSIYMSLQL